MKKVYWLLIILSLASCSISKTPQATIFTTLDAQGEILIDQTHFYWNDSGAGYIGQLNLETNIRTRLVENQPSPRRLAMDDKFIYWYDSETKDIMRISKTGEDQQLITNTSEFKSLRQLYVDDEYLYFFTHLDDDIIYFIDKQGTGQLQKIPITGVADMIRLKNMLYVLTIDDMQQVNINTLQITGFSKAKVKITDAQLTYLLIDDKYIYVSSSINRGVVLYNDVIYRYKINDPQSEEIFYEFKDAPMTGNTLAQDSEYFYSIGTTNALITRISKQDGTSTTFHNKNNEIPIGNITIDNFVVNDEWIFWKYHVFFSNSATIMKMHKP